ncbi:C4-dicarboxylate TRAP transporter substrate-binding protein [Oceanibacterium hippocampi]|uniref:Lactate-binding periplasmic protein n=1 Tax=Oceanibacterium hippocampi TaxID=745714 RepID=A0A1Y5TS96_9PROT|nr:C4-dicarboxylate TRAP transporter substrate-binding protein [Oceanibacterium hippocampi]SLN71156.1 Lactate-binding periplasmic protein precursor [Oceanibacterium hippocampi]
MRILKLLTTAALAALVATGAQAEDYPKLNLKLAHFVPANIIGSQVDQWFADEVEKRSGGNIKIKIFWSESLGKSGELLELVRSGAIDMAAVSPAYFPNELPLTGATNSLMMQFKDGRDALRVTQSLVDETEEIQEELKRANVYPIYFHTLNTYRPFCTSPIESIEDFQGKKMRSYGEYIPVMWQELGATGVNVLTNELYEALQRGTLDCAFYAHDLIKATKLYEVAKFAWDGDNALGAIPTWPIWVNWNTWNNEWPANVRELFTTVGKEAMARDVELTTAAEADALEWMVKEQGVQIVDFKDMDKVHERTTDPAELWIKKMEERNLGDVAKKMVAYWRKEAPFKD